MEININSGRHDGNMEKWEHGAKKALDDDINKPIEHLLQEVYEQHEKAQEYRIATITREYTKHVPLELQLLAEKKISCFRYKLAEMAEKQSNKIISLTRWLMGLTFALLFVTCILAIPIVKDFLKRPDTTKSIYQDKNNTKIEDKRQPAKQTPP